MDDNTTIRAIARQCEIRFDLLLNPPTRNKALGVSHTPSSIDVESFEFEDQLSRFNTWSSNLGVFATDHGSLDYRLRDSPKVKGMTIGLLQSLRHKLQCAIDYTQNASPSNLPGDGNSTTASSSSNSSESKLKKHLYTIETSINRFQRLSMTIRKSTTQNRDVIARNFVLKDDLGRDINSDFENYAVEMVHRRYPNLPDSVKQRLGKAILERRKRFVYQERHPRTLALNPQGSSRAEQKKPLNTHLATSRSGGTSGLTQDGPSSISVGLKTEKSGLAHSAMLLTTASEFTEGSTVTLPAKSTISYAISASHEGDLTLNIPPMPKVDPTAKEFQCLYCGLVLSIETGKGKGWRRHFISDLEPYVCLSDDCNQGDQLFRTAEEWFKHMQWEHFVEWVCSTPACRSLKFTELSSFEEHMRSTHSEHATESQLPMLAKSSQQPTGNICCLLCDYKPDSKLNKVDSANDIQKHMGSHLENLALLSLPWRDDVDEEIASDRKTGSGLNAGLSDRDSQIDALSLNFEDKMESPPLDVKEDLDERIYPELEELSGSIDRDSQWGFCTKTIESSMVRVHIDPILQHIIKKSLPDFGAKSKLIHQDIEGVEVNKTIEDRTAKQELQDMTVDGRQCHQVLKVPPYEAFKDTQATPNPPNRTSSAALSQPPVRYIWKPEQWNEQEGLISLHSLWNQTMDARFKIDRPTQLASLLNRPGYARHYVIRHPAINSDIPDSPGHEYKTGQIIGFVATYLTYIDQEGEKLLGSIAIILVAPVWQKKGIGSTLYNFALKQLIDTMGVRRLQVGSSWPRLLFGPLCRSPQDPGEKYPEQEERMIEWFRKHGWAIASPPPLAPIYNEQIPAGQGKFVHDLILPFTSWKPLSPISNIPKQKTSVSTLESNRAEKLQLMKSQITFRICTQADMASVLMLVDEVADVASDNLGWYDQYTRLGNEIYVKDIIVATTTTFSASPSVDLENGEYPARKKLRTDIGGMERMRLVGCAITYTPSGGNPVGSDLPWAGMGGVGPDVGGVCCVCVSATIDRESLTIGLLDACVQHLRFQGMKSLFLDTVRNHLEWFEELGFVEWACYRDIWRDVYSDSDSENDREMDA